MQTIPEGDEGHFQRGIPNGKKKKKALSKVYHFSSNTDTGNAETNEVFVDILNIYLE